MSIYEYVNYKEYVQKWIQSQVKRGRGQYTLIAQYLGISNVLTSQIFQGDKNLSLEHAYLLTEYLSLAKDEKEYFIHLVLFERAGSEKLRKFFLNKISDQQKKALTNLKEIVKHDLELSEADKAIFHSSWIYSAIRLLTPIHGFQTVDKISDKLSLPKELVLSVLEFLVTNKLCQKTDKGYSFGANRTHLESSSPFIKTRQISWRVKSFEKMDYKNSEDLFYTGPMSISKSQLKELRKKISLLISDLSKEIVNEKPETLACINIDIFEI